MASDYWKTQILSFCNTCIPYFGQTSSGLADNLPEANEIFLIFIVEYVRCWTDREHALLCKISPLTCRKLFRIKPVERRAIKKLKRTIGLRFLVILFSQIQNKLPRKSQIFKRSTCDKAGITPWSCRHRLKRIVIKTARLFLVCSLPYEGEMLGKVMS